jgi:hypothetical protein
MVSAALAALLLSAAGAAPTAAATAAPAATPAASAITPSVHASIGTGYCDRAYVPGTDQQSPNPCYLVFGGQVGLRYRLLEAGISYEGRQPFDLLTLFAYHPPTTTVVGASVGLTSTSSERWRLSLAGEGGWRRYAHFAGHGPNEWYGAADLAYAGVVGRAATGLRNPGGRTDRIEVTVAWRHDLGTATDDAGGIPGVVGGWSFTMGVGLVADW